MGSSNHAQHIQVLAESPFTLLAKAVIPRTVISTASLPEAIQGFSYVLKHSQFHQKSTHTTSCFAPTSTMKSTKLQLATLDPPIMELELVFTHWHFAPTWNGRHLDDIMPSFECFAS